jgi:hypothetical protein
MALVNSKTKQLKPLEVIQKSLEEAGPKSLPEGVTPQDAFLAIVAETRMDRTESPQIGNTVFISHFSEDGKEVAMRAFNADSAANYIQNAIAYGDWLQEQGVVRFTTDFYGEEIRQLLMAVFKKSPRFAGGGYKIFKLNNGAYRAYVNLGRSA